MAIAYIGIGSNQSPRRKWIRQAIEALNNSLSTPSHLRVSPWYESPALIEGEAAAGEKKIIQDFINCVVEVETHVAPEHLLIILQDIETRLGRIRPEPSILAEGNQQRLFHSRTIDLDLLFYDDVILQSERLTLPHPRAHLRSFVMIPMRDLNRDLRHPLLRKSMAEICYRSQLVPDIIRRIDDKGT